MRVVSIRENAEKTRVKVTLADLGVCEVLSVDIATYEACGFPAVGDEVTEEDAEAFRFDDKKRRALRTALSILSAADNSRRALYQKLLHHDVPAEIAKETVSLVVSLGYLDESRQIERQIENADRAYLGIGKILPKLAAKGYATGEIKRIYARMKEDGAIVPEETFARLVSKKFDGTPSPEECEKLRRTYGFSTADTDGF